MAAGEHFGVAPGEETITDNLSLGFTQRSLGYLDWPKSLSLTPLPLRSNVTVARFDGPGEAVLGADWALILASSTSWWLWLLQAKRLYATGRYTPRDQAQVERLVDGGQMLNCATGFVFYNGPVIGRDLTTGCWMDRPESHYGCSVVPAIVADSRATGSVPVWSDHGVGQSSIPLECLAYCTCAHGFPDADDPVPVVTTAAEAVTALFERAQGVGQRAAQAFNATRRNERAPEALAAFAQTGDARLLTRLEAFGGEQPPPNVMLVSDPGVLS